MSSPFAPTPQQTRPSPRRRGALWVVVGVVVLAAAVTITVVLASGGTNSGSPVLNQESPEGAARAFARAATDHDATGIRALTCAKQQDDADRFIVYTDYAARADEGLSRVRMTVQFERVVSAAADETAVELSYRFSGVPTEFRDEDSLVDRTEEYEMSKVDGRWFVCDDLV